MKYLNELLKELGISKVKLARYLGVSRQMVYNYLEMKSIEEWPKDKKIKLLLLFGVDEFKDIQNIKPTNDYIMKIDKKLNTIDGNDNLYAGEINYNVKNLNKKSQRVLADIIPPPIHLSPSYKTHACPGVTDFTLLYLTMISPLSR